MKESIKIFILYLIFGILMIFGIVKYNNSPTNYATIGDASFLVGMLLLIVGSVRLLNQNNLFTLVMYSYKKFYEIITNKNYTKESSKLRDYHDYLENNQKPKLPYVPIVLSGLLFFIISAYFALNRF